MSANQISKPTTGFCVAVVVVVVLVLYPLSFGPACLLVDRGHVAATPVARFYRPILQLIANGADTSRGGFRSFVGLIGAEDSGWTTSRVLDAAGLIPIKCGNWPKNPRHDEPHRSSEHCPPLVIRVHPGSLSG